MADDRLREAERVFRETGSVADEARLLTERVRAGLLAAERLELAAELHYEAAVLARGGPEGPRSHSLSDVVRGIERFGEDVVARAILVVARRCARHMPRVEGTEVCITAVEAWLACPCDHHRAELEVVAASSDQRDASLAAQVILGHERYSTAYRMSAPYEPDSALVAAIRSALVRWALAPHEPRARIAPTPGSILELRIGGANEPGSTRVLASCDRLGLGAGSTCGIKLDERAWRSEVDIARVGEGFELRTRAESGFVFLNGERAHTGALATGDVLTMADLWLEVSIHAAPFDADIERARLDASALLSRAVEPDGRLRIEAAAAMGHLGATLAASGAGIAFMLARQARSWEAASRVLPPSAATRVRLHLAREVEPVWRDAFPEDRSFGQIMAGVESWLADPTEEKRKSVHLMQRALGARLKMMRLKKPPERLTRGMAAGDVASRCMGQGDRIGEVALAALKAGVTEERSRSLIEAEILRWALAD